LRLVPALSILAMLRRGGRRVTGLLQCVPASGRAAGSALLLAVALAACGGGEAVRTAPAPASAEQGLARNIVSDFATVCLDGGDADPAGSTAALGYAAQRNERGDRVHFARQDGHVRRAFWPQDGRRCTLTVHGLEAGTLDAAFDGLVAERGASPWPVRPANPWLPPIPAASRSALILLLAGARRAAILPAAPGETRLFVTRDARGPDAGDTVLLASMVVPIRDLILGSGMQPLTPRPGEAP
jgi:hypothetical protein